MRRAVLALVLALALAGCHKQQTTEDNRARMNPVVPPSQDMPSKRAAVAPAQTRVDLSEYKISMPDTLKAGPQSFLVVNGGTMNHSLAIDGNGVSATLSQPLPRGDTGTLTVDLKAGTYTFYCPVDSHKGRGMSHTVTVK